MFLKKGYKVKKDVIIGIYGGKFTIGVGPYVLELEYEDGGKFRVDTEGGVEGFRIFGMINEDIHGGEVNAHFEGMGLIKVIQNIVGPCEILTDYGDEYDWDEVKLIGYEALKEEMGIKEGWVNKMKAKDMKEARKGNRLERYMAKIIDGDLEREEFHSTVQTEEGATIETMITSGAQMEKFVFGKFGGERKIYNNRRIERVDKRTSGVKRWAQQRLEEDTITCEFEEVKRLNAKVNTTCNMINEVRRAAKAVEEKDIAKISCGERKEGEKRVADDVMRKEGEKEEIVFTVTTPTANHDPIAEVRRVKISTALGSGKRRRENLRIINKCRNAQELDEKMALLRIWRVEIRHSQEEDRVVGDGFCGYAAMTHIVRGTNRKLDMRDRQDRLEVGMTIREMIHKAAGNVRDGWRNIRDIQLNHKERAEGAYEELMKESTHFMAHKGLEPRFWMKDSLIDGRCDELKYSRWDKSTRAVGAYELLESRFGINRNRGHVLTHGEWKHVFKERMLMFANSHYYVREKDISEDMEEAMEEVMKIWRKKLKLEGVVGNRIIEDIQLIDLTPIGPCDSLLVAEAIISKEGIPRILDLDEPDTRSRLRKIEYGLDAFDATNLELSIDLGKGSVIGSSIGSARMIQICNENNNGYIRIKEGVMERMVPKTTRPDVVYDEDTDHFYLNGVGKVEKKDITQKNNIIFWNCNGWKGDGTIDKATLLGGIAKDEDAEMMCITDVRLDNWEGLKGRASICRTLEKATGKTWGGEYISRREDKRVGGAYILHTVDWTNVKINKKIKYGIITEINGDWNGKRYRVASVYRPCFGTTEGSLRMTMDIEYKAKFEEEFWNKMGEIGNETCIIGGDFNMGKEQI